jgi:hypothetical protein
MSQNISKTTTRKENQDAFAIGGIVLVIIAARVMELETLPEINLILLHTEVN